MEYFFNRIFYCMCYSWQYNFRLLLKNKKYRERLIENKTIKVKPNGELDFSRITTMFNIVRIPTTFGLMNIILFMSFLALGSICTHIPYLPKIVAKYIDLLFAFTPFVLSYYHLYRKDKYEHYFAVFEKDSKKTRWKWNIITIFTLVLAVVAAILLFKLNAYCFPKE